MRGIGKITLKLFVSLGSFAYLCPKNAHFQWNYLIEAAEMCIIYG